jgi:2-C-methyl-D-erythritol 4-phosphate cytidylyltransferase
MELYIIIVAGGKGERFGTNIPKQFVEIAGKPLILHTFNAFEDYFSKAHFVLVLPEMEIGRWRHIAHHFDFNVPYTLVEGGPTRFHSVKNGLEVVPDGVLVAVHDASRPLVSNTTIKNCIRTATLHGTAVPVVPVVDSIRKIENGIGEALDRSKLFAVQTPQVFMSKPLKTAYNRVYNEIFTDDASVMEASGYQIFTVEGNPENIKITQPADLGFAAYILENNNV